MTALHSTSLLGQHLRSWPCFFLPMNTCEHQSNSELGFSASTSSTLNGGFVSRTWPSSRCVFVDTVGGDEPSRAMLD